MKIIATLDYIDGAESKTRVLHLDELDTTYLRMKLMEPGVASITITRADLLRKLAQLGTDASPADVLERKRS